MPKEIPLSRGMVTVVDDEDYDRLSAFKWQAVKGRRGSYYASRPLPGRTLQMQRDILDPDLILGRTLLADHRNGDTLDNRRNNLRLVDASLSNLNRRMFKNNTSGYKGVVWVPRQSRYRASTRYKGKRLILGLYKCPEEAARAYNDTIRKLYGDAIDPQFLNQVPSHG